MTEKATKLDLTEVSKDVEKLKFSKKSNLADAYVENPRLNPDKIGKNLLDRMPNPTGWRILILPYQGTAKTSGGIFIPGSVQEKNQISTQAGYVLKVGPLAYRDS